MRANTQRRTTHSTLLLGLSLCAACFPAHATPRLHEQHALASSERATASDRVTARAVTEDVTLWSREAPPPEVPSLNAIRDADLKRDLFFLASDAMRGREAGTLDELRASGWLAEQLRAIGVEPAGEDGTYYQWWPMRRMRQSDASVVRLDGTALTLWHDVIVAQATDALIDAPVVWGGTGSDADLQGIDLNGKTIAVQITPPPNAPGRTVSLSAWRYTGMAIRTQASRLTQRGARAVILVADSVVESAFDFFGAVSQRGSYGLDTAGAVTRPRANVPVLLVRQSMAGRLQSTKAQLQATLTSESFVYPSVNIIGKITGQDPKLKNEYVLFSSHQDHDGVRFPVDGDSIWNGADDNASVVVANLAIARAWKKQPNRRTALFAIQGAEERGLLGSRWHAMHPMVPRESIVAVINADMIGRNSPDSAALLGSQPPHRNSSDLVRVALHANEITAKFSIDSLWDRPTHPEGWYFRSDHLPYARANIPALMFSSNLHPDYHTPRDEPSRIDIAKMRRIAQWMYATGWLVGQSTQRPQLDAGFKLER